MKCALRDVARFLKSHWPHLLLAIPGVLAVTALHEAAHCAAALVQGGRILEFDFLPSGSEWGHMRYSFPAGAHYSAAAISLAPYLCWVLACLAAGTLALKPRPWPFWIGSTIFVWLFAVPLADIANAAIPYAIWNSTNDLRQALGPARPTAAFAFAVFGTAMAWAGYFLQKRLYREQALKPRAYAILCTCTVFLILGVTSRPRW